MSTFTDITKSCVSRTPKATTDIGSSSGTSSHVTTLHLHISNTNNTNSTHTHISTAQTHISTALTTSTPTSAADMGRGEKEERGGRERGPDGLCRELCALSSLELAPHAGALERGP
eukprot:3755107-Rhodomonas_salina.1